jgi:hypothetical protein
VASGGDSKLETGALSPFGGTVPFAQLAVPPPLPPTWGLWLSVNIRHINGGDDSYSGLLGSHRVRTNVSNEETASILRVER